MAKFTPLIGTVTGKIGGLVIGHNRTVRQFKKTPNRAPVTFKTIFAHLAASWPRGEVAAKTIVMRSPGVANGVKFMTRASGILHNLIPISPASPGNSTVLNGTKYGPMPDRLVDLPGEFGEQIQRGRLAYVAAVEDVRVTMRTPEATIDGAYFTNPRVAVIVLKVEDIKAKTHDPFKALAMSDLALNAGNWEFQIDGLAITTDYLAIFSTIATLNATGQTILLDHTAAFFQTNPQMLP